MRVETLALLRCPFCGTAPELLDNAALARTATDVEFGVLGCECCAFPIVAGIPVMIANDATRAAMHQMEAGNRERALLTLLGLDDEARAAAFRTLLAAEHPTYRDAIAVLSLDAEGQYFVYRFSDPTFLMASAVLDAVTRDTRVRAGRVLDLCGGSGHLTRVLMQLTSPAQPLLADVAFWKLWLARRFTAPGCDAVCCDANQPLPFARESCSLVVCSDAFPYIWQKRLLASEMRRLAGDEGLVVLPHLHSAWGDNVSAGMTLTPPAYVDLFEPLPARLFKDSALLTQLLDGAPLDLGSDAAPETVHGEPSLTLIATSRTDLFRTYEPRPAATTVHGTLAVNPLYRIDYRDGASQLTLTFPTEEYEAEFPESRRYLPQTVTVPADLRRPFDARIIGDAYADLLQRRVLIDAPIDYV